MDKLYEERPVHKGGRLGKLFLQHIDHMTSEDLHSKADIAAELAYRDELIEILGSNLRDCLEELIKAKKSAKRHSEGQPGI